MKEGGCKQDKRPEESPAQQGQSYWSQSMGRQKRTASVAETEEGRRHRERKGRRDKCVGLTASVNLDWSTMSSMGAISGKNGASRPRELAVTSASGGYQSGSVGMEGGFTRAVYRRDNVGGQVSAGRQTFQKQCAGVHVQRLLCGSRPSGLCSASQAEVWAWTHVWVRARCGVR